MRPRFAKTTLLAAAAAQMMLATGCGDDSTPDSTLEIAQDLGSTIATPGGGGEAGALVDAAILARGGRPVGFTQDGAGLYSGSHDDVIYTYMVYGSGDTVQVVGEWKAGELQRQGMWTLDHLTTPMATVTGSSTCTTAMMHAVGDAAIQLDMGSYEMASGTMSFTMHPMMHHRTMAATMTIQPDRSALLVVDGRSYRLDLSTGAVSRPML